MLADIAIADHNDAHWLEIVHWPASKSVKFVGPMMVRYGREFAPGWYVLRRCPCHDGHPVTLPRPSRSEAERALAGMLRSSRAMGT